jgi:hypothetical protein
MSAQNQWMRQPDMLFVVRRSVRYHNKRKRFFERMRRMLNFVTMALGVATLGILLAKVDTGWAISTAAAVSFFAMIDLLLNTSEGARLHADLSRRYLDLEADLVKAGEHPGEEQARDFSAQRLRIASEEPPMMRVLDCECHNDLVRAMGRGELCPLKLTRSQRFIANFWDISPGDFKINMETGSLTPMAGAGART